MNWFPTHKQQLHYKFGGPRNPSYLHSLWIGLVVAPINGPRLIGALLLGPLATSTARLIHAIARLLMTFAGFMWLLWCALLMPPIMGLFGRMGAGAGEAPSTPVAKKK